MKPKTSLLSLAIFALSLGAQGKDLTLHHRSQVEVAPQTGRYHSLTKPATWDAAKTAVVICDMWDDHYCRLSAKRVAEMAPRMNETIKKARAEGALIIHCPSGCMDKYEGTPQRKLAQGAPVVETKFPLEKWCYIDKTREPELPVKIEQPCDDAEADRREKIRFYTRQIETLEIADGDAITDSAEAYFLMKQRGIENVIIMGVHTNMCVLGRPFGIRQLVRQGMNVVLMRDLTDSMYNPEEEPFVSHFTGNDLIFEHIERHWCPTVTSADLLGGQPFRFAADTRKHLVIVTAEDEYKTEETLLPFAIRELGKEFKISVVYGAADDKTTLPGAEVIGQADVILLAVRRRNFPKEQLDLFRAHLAAGKPLVGVRTASHAFHQRDKAAPAGLVEWRDFDATILGGNYSGHHSDKLTTFAKPVASAAQHPILAGIPADEFRTFGSLYQNEPLQKGANLLLSGRADTITEAEPVAWTHASPAGGRVFYTSLGHPGDFDVPAFRTLLKNAVLWAAGN
jgi:type 1 glutamine amidotransferase/nicotinamidase-related amidase